MSGIVYWVATPLGRVAQGMGVATLPYLEGIVGVALGGRKCPIRGAPLAPETPPKETPLVGCGPGRRRAGGGAWFPGFRA